MDTSNIGRRAPGERKPRPSEPPSHELTFADNGDALPPVGITFRTTTLTLCPTCERMRPLLDEAVAQLDHLREAANINGYTEYQDLQYTLRALQRAVDGREVSSDA